MQTTGGGDLAKTMTERPAGGQAAPIVAAKKAVLLTGAAGFALLQIGPASVEKLGGFATFPATQSDNLIGFLNSEFVPPMQRYGMKLEERYWIEEDALKIQERTLEKLRNMPPVDLQEEARKIERETLRRIRALADRTR